MPADTEHPEIITVTRVDDDSESLPSSSADTAAPVPVDACLASCPPRALKGSRESSFLSRIRKRELSMPGSLNFKRRSSHALFGGGHTPFSLHAELDTRDPSNVDLAALTQGRPSKVAEIVSSGEIVFALTLSGACSAFRGVQRLCFLNSSADEVIRSLFYNKASETQAMSREPAKHAS